MIETLMSTIDRCGIDMSARGAELASGESLENPRVPFSRVFDLQGSASGQIITEETSLRLTAVYASVRILSNALAKVPFQVFRTTKDGQEPAPDHYLWPLLMVSSNQHTTAFRFRRQMQAWLLLWGNAYARMIMPGNGRVTALEMMPPNQVTISGTLETGLVYEYRPQGADAMKLTSHEVLHLRGLEMNGLSGLSPIRCAMTALGVGAAAEEYGARFFKNNGRPGGWVSHPQTLSKQAIKNIRETLEEVHMGVQNSNRLGILEEGMQYHDVGMPADEMQFLETRQFSVIDIARLFGVPPHMLADLSRATFSNIEQQGLDFTSGSLGDWCANWESECTAQLLSTSEAKSFKLEFILDGLQRGDALGRYRVYALGRQWGMLSANDARKMERLNNRPDPAGDDYLEPLNMVPAGDELEADALESGGTDPAEKEPAPPAPAKGKGAKK